jgi:hypothetical protein
VYNNFPWPENPSQKQKDLVESHANNIITVRNKFDQNSLADLYDPNSMPPDLVKAHQQLDRAVDLCYRPHPFTDESRRIEFLFDLYEKYTGGLFVPEKKKKPSVKNRTQNNSQKTVPQLVPRKIKNP